MRQRGDGKLEKAEAAEAVLHPLVKDTAVQSPAAKGPSDMLSRCSIHVGGITTPSVQALPRAMTNLDTCALQTIHALFSFYMRS